jgi:hypothetical protein
MVTWVGFVAGLVGMASPSYWGSFIGLTVGGAAISRNIAKDDKKLASYAIAGTAAAVLGFIFSAIASVS